MAAFVNPANAASYAEMTRIEAAALAKASVIEILRATASARMVDVQKNYRQLSLLVHPHRGGSFDKRKATNTMVVVARSWEQARRAAEFDAYERSGNIWTSTPYTKISVSPRFFGIPLRTRRTKPSFFERRKPQRSWRRVWLMP